MGIIANLLSTDDRTFNASVGTWTAGSNTSIARPDGFSLTLTSSAAGTMAASTGKYGVTAGQQYEAYTSVWNRVAASGRIVSIRIDWYTAADVYISSSTTASPITLPNSTAVSGPLITIGTAPGTATQAAIQVNVTAGITGAGQQVNIDDLGLGVAAAVAGNLLPYDVESSEMGVGGWTGTNATLSRTTGATEGSYSLRALSSGSGAVSVTAAVRYPVTAGVEYAVTADCFTATAGSPSIDLRWYAASSGGSPISTSTGSHAATVSAWTRITAVGTAPVGAGYVLVVLKSTASAGSQAWNWDTIALRPTSLLLSAGNLLPWVAQAVEIDTSAWQAGTNTTIAQSAVGDPAAGAYSLKATATAGGQMRIQLASTVAVTPGEDYVVQASYRTTGATAAAAWADIDWYDASMVALGSGFPDQNGTLPGDTWNPALVGRQAPAGAAFARPVLLPQATAPGQIFYLDDMFFGVSDPPYSVVPNGATASVTITLSGLTGMDRLSLYRSDPGGTLTPVRGADGDITALAIASDLFVVEDYEAPLGGAISYQYQRWNTGTPETVYTTGTYQVTLPDPPEVFQLWVKDPGRPSSNLLLAAHKIGAWSRAIEQGVYPIRGAAFPVTVSDVRQARTGSLEVYTWTPDEQAALHWLVGTGAVLLLQGLGLGSVYVAVGDVQDASVTDDGVDQWRIWTLELTEVARPRGGMQGSAERTWQDVADDHATWLDVAATYTTWLGVLTGEAGT